MSQLAKAWMGDRSRSCVISLISVVIGMPLACLCIVGAVTLGNSLGPVDSRLVPWILVGIGVVGVVVLLTIQFGAVAWSVWRRARWLDGIFSPLGLTGRLYMLRGRQYQGNVLGREVDIRFYQGPTLEIYVTTLVMTRFSVAEQAAVIPGLAGAFNREMVTLNDLALSDWSVFALDGNWTRMLLAQPEAQAALARLMRASEWAMFRQVHLQPGAFLLRLYRNRNVFRYDIAPQEGQQWVHDLMALARVAESLPPPAVTAPVSSAEQLVRSGKIGRATLPITISVAVVLLVGLPLCAIAIAVAMLALNR